MNFRSILLAGSVAGLAWLLPGCTATPMSRIDANRPLYESFPVEMRQAILDGRIEKGMTPAMVEMSIGKPAQIESRQARRGIVEEVWIYGVPTSSSGTRNTSASIGIGGIAIGGLGGGGGGATGEYREVVFVNGEVVSGSDGN